MPGTRPRPTTVPQTSGHPMTTSTVPPTTTTTTTTTTIPASAPANPNKALWENGDFTRIAATMRASGEDLVRRIGVEPGISVLDLGCGDGTTAIPSAQIGA